MKVKAQNIKKKLGEKVRTERIKLGVSQEELALAVGVDQNHISEVERGMQNPTLITLYKLSKALKLSLSDLVDFE